MIERARDEEEEKRVERAMTIERDTRIGEGRRRER